MMQRVKSDDGLVFRVFVKYGVLRFFLILLFYAGLAGSTPSPAQTHSPAPSFHLQDLKGKFHHLSDFNGKALIVNFWATWCGPCRKELLSMNRAWSVLKDEAVVMLAVNVGEDQEAVTAFTRDYPIDFKVLLDGDGNTNQRWRVTGILTTFLVNPQGKTVYRMIGEREWDSKQLLQLVRGLNE